MAPKGLAKAAMLKLVLPELVLVASLATGQTDLVAAAAASGRPEECRPSRQAAGPSVWDRARQPKLRAYCNLLARAQTRLAHDPANARAAAERANRLYPGRAAPHVGLARAAVKLGKVDEALAQFERALTLDPRSVDHPVAMHDLATVLWRSGQLDRAVEVYRTLVPRAGWLPTRLARARALLEAAHAAMAAAAARGEDAVPAEVLAYLREATANPHHALRLDVELALVLALDRAGQTAQANAKLDELRQVARWSVGRRATYLMDEHDGIALQALAIEPRDPRAAAQLWQRFLDSPAGQGPWAKAASHRLEQLRRAPPRPARARPRGRRR